MKTETVVSGLVMVVLGGAVILAACQGDASALEQPAPTQPPAGLMAEVSLVFTVTTTPSPTITPDYSGLYPTQTAVSLLQTQVSLNQIEADSASTQTSNLTTQQAVTIQDGTPTAFTLSVNQTETTSKITATAAAQVAADRAEKDRIANEAAAEAARRAEFFAWLWRWIGFALLIAGGLYVISLLVAISIRAFKEPEKKAEVRAPAPELEPVDHTQVVMNDGNTVFDRATPISQIEKALLQDAVLVLDNQLSRRRLAGRDSNDKLVRGWKEWFKENRAEEILKILKSSYADGGSAWAVQVGQFTMMTPEGLTWLGISPLPRMNKPENAENPAESHPTPPRAPATPPENTVGEGDRSAS